MAQPQSGPAGEVSTAQLQPGTVEEERRHGWAPNRPCRGERRCGSAPNSEVGGRGCGPVQGWGAPFGFGNLVGGRVATLMTTCPLPIFWTFVS